MLKLKTIDNAFLSTNDLQLTSFIFLDNVFEYKYGVHMQPLPSLEKFKYIFGKKLMPLPAGISQRTPLDDSF